jgi:hypothetical protein
MSRAAGLGDRFVFVIVASALIVAGALALYWPTTLDDYDRWGFAISCGSGLSTDYEQAAAADHDSSSDQPQTRRAAGRSYVGKCHSAIRWRRAWATSLVIIGALGFTALQFRGHRPVRPKTSTE